MSVVERRVDGTLTARLDETQPRPGAAAQRRPQRPALRQTRRSGVRPATEQVKLAEKSRIWRPNGGHGELAPPIRSAGLEPAGQGTRRYGCQKGCSK